MRDARGTGMAGVTVSDGTRSATTASDGSYTLSNVPIGSYTLTPTKGGYSFSPTTRSVTVSGNMSGQDFTGTLITYSVGGRVTLNGSSLAGVTISDGTRSATTASDGSYTLSNVPPGSYTLTPAKSGYSFSPATRSISVSGNNVSSQDFSATLITYSVGGRVTLSGSGIAGVTVSDGTRSATTASDGSYTLSNVPPGSYTLTPAKSGYSFSPATRSVSVTANNLSGQDFSATKVDSGGSEIVQSLSPSEGVSSHTTRISVHGSDFATSPAPTARLSGSAGVFTLTTVTPQSATSFAATVPANLPPGIYDLIVMTNGHTGALANAFTVLAPSPLITKATPTSGLNDRTTDLFVWGLNFADGAVVKLGSATLSATRINGTVLLATVPAGLSPNTYDLTVINPDSTQAQLTTAYTVLDAAGTQYDDLLSSGDQIWLAPAAPRANMPVQLGIFVQRDGGSTTLEDVMVEFRRDAIHGPLLGTATVPFLDSLTSNESTNPLEVTFSTAGDVTIYAIIDPEGAVAERTTANNVVSRTIVVAPATADQTIPVVQAISINGDSNTSVTTQDIMVGIDAIDPPPNASGVESVHIIEYVYNDGAQRWVPVAKSGWIPYTQTPDYYRWSLLPLPGMRYMQVRARDAANNISIGNARQLINYEVATDHIARDQTRIYRYNVAAGQSFSVNLEVLSGDADLYVWSSRTDQSARVSNQEGSASEQVVIPASEVVPGVYQVEVYGYSAAEYRLSTSNGLTLANAGGGLAASKAVPSAPVVPVADMPDERAGSVPPSELAGNYTVYLPLIAR
ncbi:carboxypeptidase-like regulatory domain-containing protein [Oscillochloris sp. ZM17-4]|uniref:beta-sandwich domain-containing protein n=1 Tax=Oscillochloris sp. ZM17-4 TaxID=2866714 RepID=UPI001C7353CC|nr:carboxypeptidase-like regulatory domain-containing protein [Oscillochloris sp. ZM17-4]